MTNNVFSGTLNPTQSINQVRLKRTFGDNYNRFFTGRLHFLSPVQNADRVKEVPELVMSARKTASTDEGMNLWPVVAVHKFNFTYF